MADALPDLSLVFSVVFVLELSLTQYMLLVGITCSCMLSVLLRPREVTERLRQIH